MGTAPIPSSREADEAMDDTITTQWSWRPWTWTLGERIWFVLMAFLLMIAFGLVVRVLSS